MGGVQFRGNRYWYRQRSQVALRLFCVLMVQADVEASRTTLTVTRA